ncbi:MAG: hypothetical protein ABIN25_09965 [Ginsengibacter sp.]
MKKIFTILVITAIFLFASENAPAQDTTKTSAIKLVNETSEQADKLYGKKIQHQTLSLQSFEMTDTTAIKKENRKKCKNCKRKH